MTPTVSPANARQLASELFAALHARSISKMKVALNNGANPNAVHSGYEILYHAVNAFSISIHPIQETNMISCMELLLEHGAQPSRSLALSRACHFNLPILISLFLKHGADVNELNSDHLTPLHHLAIFQTTQLHSLPRPYHPSDIKDSVSILLHAGANPTLTNREGLTPSQYARKYSHLHGRASNADLLEVFIESHQIHQHTAPATKKECKPRII